MHLQKDIVVYIDDHWFQHDFHVKTCQQVNVPFQLCSDEGDYQVRFRDILSQLQGKPAAIPTGSGMLHD